MGLREEKKEELRRQIRATALSLFGEHGISATRVADIAALLRISEATFFNYFPSKQAICEEAVSDLITGAIGRSAVATESRSVCDQLRLLTTDLIEQLTADRPLVALLRRQPEMVSAGLARTQRPNPQLDDLIIQAQQRGELRSDLPADVLSETYLTIVLMTISRILPAGGSSTELAEAADQALQIWTHGGAARVPSGGRRSRRIATAAGA